MRELRSLALVTIACAGASPAPTGAPAPNRTSASAPTATPAPAPPPSAGPAPAPAPASASVPKSFPPQDIPPPHARSAEANDGRFIPLYGGAPELGGSADSPFAQTLIHPHEASRFITVTIVAIDLRSTSVHFMPGKEDLGGKKVPFMAGLVPADEHERLLAVFNGGFQPRHGGWGMKRGDSTVVPPRDTGCTLALYADGSVRLRTWSALAATESEMRAFRQTPPCLVEEGAVHADLLAGRDKAWKGNTAGIVTRRRSAIGLDESGTVLFYAVGIEATPRLLAEALRVAGARNAAELDINWAWTRFLFYGKNEEGKIRVTHSLVEGEYGKSGYVERASDRDFFYVLRK